MHRIASLRSFTQRRSVPPTGFYCDQHLHRYRPHNFLANTIKGDFKIGSHRQFRWTAVRLFSSTTIDGRLSSDDLNKQIVYLSKSGEIAEVQQLFHQSQIDALAHHNGDLLPNIKSYTSYMNALLNNQRQLLNQEDAVANIVSLAEKAHDLLVYMEDISGVSDMHSSMRLIGVIDSNGIRQPNLQPASCHYDVVLESLANACCAAEDVHYTTNFTSNAPYISQRWLQRMETLAAEDLNHHDTTVAPTIQSYHNAMKACSVIAISNKQSKSTILTQAIFDKLKQNPNLIPTSNEYRLLLQTWSRSNCKDSAYRATGVWTTMLWAFRSEIEEGIIEEPTLEDGKMVLKAWSRAVNKHAARRANNVLSRMEKLYTQKTTSVRPDLDCYRLLLTTLSKTKEYDMGQVIPTLFKTMEDNQLFPDTECYDSAIQTLSNCTRYTKDKKERAEYSKMAEGMLTMMETENERSSVSVVKPNAKSYTYVILALGALHTKHAAEKTTALLKKMEVEYYENGDESMKPTRDSYVGVINAFGYCGSERGFIKANTFLQQMIFHHANGNEMARPDAEAYHAVVRACSQVSDNKTSTPEREKEALVLAISAVQDMKKTEAVHTNSRTYHLLLQCCTNLLPEGSNEREKAVCSVFRSCAKDGLVSQQILQEFQSCVSPEVYYREVVADAPYFEEVRIIPEKWTRNLGYRVRVKDVLHEGGEVNGKRSPIISVMGSVVSTMEYNDYRMRRRWEKRGQKLLQGGRV